MPTNTYTPIASVTLSATASEVVFSGLPQTFRDLIVVVEGTGDSNFNPLFHLNGDTASNYTLVAMIGSGSGSGSSVALTSNGWGVMLNSANGRSTNIYQFMDYSQTNKHKTVLLRTSQGNGGDVLAYATRWANNSAINTMRIYGGNFLTGCTFTIFGVIA